MDMRTFIVNLKWRQLLPMLLLLAVAAGLRLYKIDAQSLWYDEGNSARIAERSVELIIAGAAGDIHPPLYYLLLKFWRALFGSGEAALRSLSAACGVLTVLLAQRTGRLLAGERAAWAAGVLTAIAPLAVYYGQEARMYALLALFAALSSWALFHMLRAQRPLWTALLALATAGGLWTHYAYPPWRTCEPAAKRTTRAAALLPRQLRRHRIIRAMAAGGHRADLRLVGGSAAVHRARSAAGCAALDHRRPHAAAE